MPHSTMWSMVNMGIEREVIGSFENDDYDKSMDAWNDESAVGRIEKTPGKHKALQPT